MTEQEFKDKYFKNSDITEEDLKKYIFIPIPCDCGENFCEGWKMAIKSKD